MLSFLSRYGPGGEAIPGKFNFGVGTGEGDRSSGDGGLEAAGLLFRLEVVSPPKLSLVGRTSGRNGLTIDNDPNSELYNSGDTGPLLEISILEIQWRWRFGGSSSVV